MVGRKRRPITDPRECRRCKASKPLSEFYALKDGKVTVECKVCRRDRARDGYARKAKDPEFRAANVKRATAWIVANRDQYREAYRRRKLNLPANKKRRPRRPTFSSSISATKGRRLAAVLTWAAQGGRCAICARSIIWNEPLANRGAVVDHCHVSGELRGVLCGHCNVALGHFNDDPAILMRAIEYLQRHQEVIDAYRKKR